MSNSTSVVVNHITKTYGNRAVVNDISFVANGGEILGLIGPNGAGKTTTIRMMMDIIKPDSGEIDVIGEKLNENSKNRIGYLPEERGLYKKLRIIDTLVYFASLKGMDEANARQKAGELLRQVGLQTHSQKKIEELSRGMGQLIQFLVTIIHDPQLIILDEPFAGLDPVNSELLKEMILGLRNQGKTLILSTHRMNEVEELCDRILMINRGQQVLYGNLAQIKSGYRGNSIILSYEGELDDITGVTKRPGATKDTVELVLDENITYRQVLEKLVEQNVVINRFEVATPTLHEIFLKVVGEEA